MPASMDRALAAAPLGETCREETVTRQTGESKVGSGSCGDNMNRLCQGTTEPTAEKAAIAHDAANECECIPGGKEARQQG
jgi:hypothetical protein